MDQEQKKPASDLAELKLRLGLRAPAKPADNTPAGASPTTPAADRREPTPPAVSKSAPAWPAVGSEIVAPVGVKVPAPDPFAMQQAPRRVTRPVQILDAGPPVEIPQTQTKRPWAVYIIVGIVVVGLGWTMRSLYGDRREFNQSIDDAQQISNQVADITKVNAAIGDALNQAQVRNKGIIYDQALVDALKGVIAENEDTAAQRIEREQERLFHTNYRRMANVVAPLLHFYDSSLRLRRLTESFIRRAESNKEELIKYVSNVREQAGRNYGIVISEDIGFAYLGTLVEIVGACKDDKKTFDDCRPEQKGFSVRVGTADQWQFRPGKGTNLGKIGEWVIPINVRDEMWRQVAVGTPGYLTFKEFVRNVAELRELSELLTREQTELTQQLDGRAKAAKLFAPI